MPEMLTKHPDVALKILKDAKISCGRGNTPKILVTCPPNDFCALPTGELCIYGIADIPKMTQITAFDVFLLPDMVLPLLAFIVIIFVFGVFFGVKIRRR